MTVALIPGTWDLRGFVLSPRRVGCKGAGSGSSGGAVSLDGSGGEVQGTGRSGEAGAGRVGEPPRLPIPFHSLIGLGQHRSGLL